MLFRMRFNSDDLSERSAFVSSLDLDWWEPVTDDEKIRYAAELAAMTSGKKMNNEDGTWFKVDWERVPDLVESRRVFLKAGKAYVPGREQSSMVVAEFTSRLERQLEVSHGLCLVTKSILESITANVGDFFATSLRPELCRVWTKTTD